ncbi:MFS general substrate transporter, partial [Aulographum hederae CBS 113979]
NYSKPPIGLRWRSHSGFIIFVIGGGMFSDLFLYGLIVPLLPFMLGERIHLPDSKIQTYTSVLLAVYAAAQFVLSPIAGVFADKVKTRQAPFLAGLASLLIATILLGVGQSIAVLSIARIFQGASAAVVWTIGLAMCLETVGPSRLGTTIGSIFSFVSVGTFASPVLGGILYRETGYIGVFGVGTGILVVDFILRILVIEKKTAAKYAADAASTCSKHSNFPGPNEPTTNGTMNENTPLIQRQPSDSSEEIDPDYRFSTQTPPWLSSFPVLACLHDASLLTSLLVGFMQALLLASFDATVPTVAKQYYNFDSFSAGLLFVPLGVADMIIGPLAGYATDKLGVKIATTFGFALLTPSLILFRLVKPGGGKEIAVFSVLLALGGAGSSIISSGSIVEAGAAVERYYRANKEFFGHKEPYAQLYGISAMMFSAGLTLGPLVAGSLKDSIGYGNMNAVLGAVCGIAGVLCFLFIEGRPSCWPKK